MLHEQYAELLLQKFCSRSSVEEALLAKGKVKINLDTLYAVCTTDSVAIENSNQSSMLFKADDIMIFLTFFDIWFYAY